MIKTISLIQDEKVKQLDDGTIFPDGIVLKECVIGTSKTGKAVLQAFIEAILRLKSESTKTGEIRGSEAYAFLKRSVIIFDRKV